MTLSPDRRVARAVQVRVADSALRAIEAATPDLLAGLVRDGITVPRTEQSVSQGWSSCTVVACPSGCRIPIQLAPQHPVELRLDPPDRVRASVRVAVPFTTIPVEGCSIALNFTIDTSRGARATIGLRTAATVRTEVRAERASYDRVDIENFDEVPGEELEDADFDCRASGLGRVVCGAVNTFLRDAIHQRLRAQLGVATGQVRSALGEPSTDPPGCPAGTHADGSHCAYADGSVVPVLMGIDGEVGATRTGTASAGDPLVRWLLAAGDPYASPNVGANAVTAMAFGAAYATGHASCVPRVDAPRSPIIPELTSLRTSGAGDVTLAVSEDFVNAALFAMWDGGQMCSDREQPRSSEFATALVNALPAASPLRSALLPTGATSFGVAVHVDRPPRVTFGAGTDRTHEPLMRVLVPQLTIEFLDVRTSTPARLLSVVSDATANANVTLAGNELRASIDSVTFANATANGTGVTPDVTSAASTFVTANATTFVTRALGELFPVVLPRVALPAAGTVELTPVPNSIAGASEGSSRFLTVSANVRYRAR
jgi:hypothetical protein